MATDSDSPAPHQCMICLEDLSLATDRGYLPCSHSQFCFRCICDWAKVTNSCPHCKAQFSLIMKMVGTRLTESYELVEAKGQRAVFDVEEPPDYVESVSCEVCLDAGHEEILMLCDNCDRGFHTLCIGLVGVPEVEEWYCDKCLEAMDLGVKKAQWKAVALVASLPRDRSTEEGKQRKRLRKIKDLEEETIEENSSSEADVLIIS